MVDKLSGKLPNQIKEKALKDLAAVLEDKSVPPLDIKISLDEEGSKAGQQETLPSFEGQSSSGRGVVV